MRCLVVSCALLLYPSVAFAGEPSFRNEVMAVLSRAGCNAGACHGNLNGKGGLKLSLRGENAWADYSTLTRDQLGRRVNSTAPTDSLLLNKAAGTMPHEGGARFTTASREYAVLRDWMGAGAKFDAAAPQPTALAVEPAVAVVFAPKDRVQIQVAVKWPDGTTRQLNDLATFEPTTVGTATVGRFGEVVRVQPGELVVLVRYLNLMTPVRIAFVPDRPAADLSKFSEVNIVDRHAKTPWQELRITPSGIAGDGEFLRRVYLDTLGIVPTADEARAFLADANPNKRKVLIDALLERPEYAQHWAQKWSDLLRNEEKALDKKGVQVFHRWIKEAIAEDRPLTEFAAAVLAGRGSTYTEPPANFYRAIRDPYLRAESVAQVFLGLRISCAKCHNHPFDAWTQDDYHRFAGNFARIGYRILANDKRDNLDSHEFVGEQIVHMLTSGELTHPQGGKALPKLLGGAAVDPEADRLSVLATWVTSPTNPFFAKAQVNRIWLHLMGRGLVDPNDDFRTSNPPSNPALLDALVREFTYSGTRAKPLIRLILNSATYQRSSTATGFGTGDDKHFAKAVTHPLQAEQLLDALSGALGTPVKFPNTPVGMRAGEMAAAPQTGRGRSNMGMRFLKVFGKPDRLLTCECERSEDPGVLQALQLMTGPLLNELLEAEDNRIGRGLAAGIKPNAMLDDLYLASVCRFPTDAERTALLKHIIASREPRRAWEDVAWGLVNSKEFLLRR